MTPADKDREYWRKHREDMVRKELIRQGKIPNFIMTNGAPKLEEPIRDLRHEFSFLAKLVITLCVLLGSALAYRYLR